MSEKDVKYYKYADYLREKINKKIKEEKEKTKKEYNSKYSSLFFYPPVGKRNVRLLPAKNPEEIFYYSHSYHYLENEKGGYLLWTRKFYEVDGKLLRCPIDEAVQQWYASKDESLKKLASLCKRKRHYFVNIIDLDEEDENKKYKILVDTSNDAKLIKKICSLSGIPFFKDVEDEWLDLSSTEIDTEKELYDLFSFYEGRDLRIIKISEGNKPWNISYEETFPLKPRALTEKEIQIAQEVVDLKTIKDDEYVDYYKAKQALEEFIDFKLNSFYKIGKEEKSKDKKISINIENKNLAEIEKEIYENETYSHKKEKTSPSTIVVNENENKSSKEGEDLDVEEIIKRISIY